MAIDYTPRLAGPFVGDGTVQSSFPFSFFIFDPTDVYVAFLSDPDAEQVRLEYGKDFTVQMNEDQRATPGGVVNLLTTSPTVTFGLLRLGQVLAIGSNIPYTNTLSLTNFTRFPPERITTELDRIVAQIQQIDERLGRTVSMDETDSSSGAEFRQRVFAAATDAETAATKASDAASKALEILSRVESAEGSMDATSGLFVKRQGNRGEIAGYEISGASTVIEETSPDANEVGADVVVRSGSSGTAWTKVVRFTASASVTLGNGWAWAGGEAPTITAGGILVCCWCGSGGVATFTSVEAA